MQSVTKLPNLKGARVLVRVDYNVPIKGNKIVDARRIESSYKTIDLILKKNGNPVLITHLGKGEESLRPVATFLSKRYKIVLVQNDVFESKTKDILNAVPTGTVILLENIRRYEGEEKNDAKLSRALATLGDYFVNDAFSVSHRKHASVVGIPKHLKSFAGFQLEAEIKALDFVLNTKKHPSLFILGGSKFSTKIPLLSRFEDKADSLVITGAILNNFYKVAGFPVGKSVIEEGYDKQIKTLLKNPKFLIPSDVVVERDGKSVNVTPDEVQPNDIIVDIGKESIELIKNRINKAKLIVWNGPTGWYEKGYTKATISLAKEMIQTKASAVIGGGDTGAVIEKLIDGNSKKVFISTGGGATLEYLAKGTLPGIQCLK